MNETKAGEVWVGCRFFLSHGALCFFNLRAVERVAAPSHPAACCCLMCALPRGARGLRPFGVILLTSNESEKERRERGGGRGSESGGVGGGGGGGEGGGGVLSFFPFCCFIALTVCVPIFGGRASEGTDTHTRRAGRRERSGFGDDREEVADTHLTPRFGLPPPLPVTQHTLPTSPPTWPPWCVVLETRTPTGWRHGLDAPRRPGARSETRAENVSAGKRNEKTGGADPAAPSPPPFLPDSPRLRPQGVLLPLHRRQVRRP